MVPVTMPIGMSRSVSGSSVAAAGLALAIGDQRRANAGDDRADDLEQGPDRGDADRAGANHARLLPECRADQRFEVAAGLRDEAGVLRPVRDDERPR